MPRPVHFEIHSSDPRRTIEFYSALFEWEFDQWGDQDYWLIKTGTDEPGIDGGLLPRQGAAPGSEQPVNSFLCTISVPSVDDFAHKARSLGGSVAIPKMAVKSVGWLIYLRDPDGNLFGMMETDPSAA
jgi:hypothetical protein